LEQTPRPLSVEFLGGDRYRVSGGSEPHVMTVHPNGPLCNCKDFQFGKRRGLSCKHIDVLSQAQAAGEAIPPAAEVSGFRDGGPGLQPDVPPPDPPARAIALVPADPAEISRATDAAERAVLGAILLEHTIPPGVLEVLGQTGRMFQRERNRILYELAIGLWKRGEPIDPVNLKEVGNGDLDRAGGIEYVATLIDEVPTALHAPSHARRVQEAHQLRELASLGRQLQDAGVDLAGARAALERLAGLATASSRFRLLTIDELLGLPPRSWILERHIPEGGLAVLYGAANVGKSFVALSMACAIAAGVPWLGWTTRPGAVLYVAAEGSWGLAERYRAWMNAEGVEIPQLRVLPEPVNLLMPDEVTALLATVAASFPNPPALFVFDTLASSMAGGDENGPDMQVAVDAARRISRKTGAAVLLVHHTGRDESRQKAERGHTSLRGAADVMFKVTAEDGALKLDNDKARDSKLLDQLLLRLLPVAGSCVVQPNTAGPISTDLTKPERAALEALAAVAQEDGATATEWLASSQLPNGSFYRARRRLIDLGLVRRELKAKRYFLTGKGIVGGLPTPK
jgi:hypothetical protein